MSEGEPIVVASGIIRIQPADFLRQLTTFRTAGGSRTARLAAIARFVALFAGQLWHLYGPVAPRRPPAPELGRRRRRAAGGR